MKILTHENIQATASGKTILIGEHSAVYGHKAIAVALPDIQLTLTLYSHNNAKYNTSSWNHAWHTTQLNKEVVMEERINNLLLLAFKKALSLVEFSFLLEDFIPQKFLINSQIPLGGGMGGSAAISTCLVRIAAQIAKVSLSLDQQIQFANEVDSLFHSGKASGLDVSAVASNGVIEFQKGSPIKQLHNKVHVWIALIDSGERSETSFMVEKVKNYYDTSTQLVTELFQKLNQLASTCSQALEQGNLNEFVNSLNNSHDCLVKLGVSTNKVNNIVMNLKKQGALAAKLTGAGGGGLVLGIFAKEPIFLYEIYGKEFVYISYL
ncbi:MAG: mevalonate kinase [Bdellovibrionota bacterium]